MGIKTLSTTGAGYPIETNIFYPSAIYYNGTTYVVWQATSDFDPYIDCYDHTAKTWSGAVQLGTNPLSGDSHGCPIIAIDNNSYLHVFFGSHNSALKHSKSDNPEDISAWTVQTDAISAGATYPTVITNGDYMYLFFRLNDAPNGRWKYKYSGDNGASWSGEFTIIDFVTDDSLGVYAFFCDAYDSVNGRFHVAFMYREAGAPYHNFNVYHAYLKLSDGHMYAMDGTDLGTTIIKAEADANCKIVAEETYWIKYLGIHLDDNAYPYIIFEQETATTQDGNFIRWSGSSWEAVDTIHSATTIFAGDFIVNSSTDIEGYFGNDSNIEGWRWDGTSWAKVNTIMTNSLSNSDYLALAKIVSNYDDSLKFIFSDAGACDVVDEGVYAYHTFLMTYDLDWDMGTKSASDDNYEIETTRNNPGITEHQIELGSIKGDEFDDAAAGDCFKETITYAPYDDAEAGSSGGSTDKNTTTAGRRRIALTGHSANTKYGVLSDFGYSGDFDVEVQLNVIDLPATPTGNCGLAIQEDSDNLVFIARTRSNTTNKINSYGRVGGVWSSESAYDTSDSEVWLRITRVSDTITVWYKLNSGDSWTSLVAYSSYWTGVAKPAFWVRSTGSYPTVRAEFSNWELNSGTVAAGGYRSSGEWVDTGIFMPYGKRIDEFTITHSGLSAIYTITPKILRLSDDAVLWTGSAITSGASTSYDTTDFGTIDVDFKVQYIFAGDGVDTPIVTEVSGTFGVGGGWSGKINEVTNPEKVSGVSKANISKVNGVS